MDNHSKGCLYLQTGALDDCRCTDESRLYLRHARRSLFLLGLQGGASWYTNSLALLADTVHVAVDLAENMLSAFIAHKARTSANEDRLRYWGGLASLVLIGFTSFWILDEALDRLSSPVEVRAWGALSVALVGLVVNLWQIRDHLRAHLEHKNVTWRRQMLHFAGDIGGSIAAFIGLTVSALGFPLGDTLASLVVVAVIWYRVALALREPRHHHDRSH